MKTSKAKSTFLNVGPEDQTLEALQRSECLMDNDEALCPEAGARGGSPLGAGRGCDFANVDQFKIQCLILLLL